MYCKFDFNSNFNTLCSIASIWCANPTIDSRVRLSQTLKLQHTQLLAVVRINKLMELHSRFEPNSFKMSKYSTEFVLQVVARVSKKAKMYKKFEKISVYILMVDFCSFFFFSFKSWCGGLSN